MSTNFQLKCCCVKCKQETTTSQLSRSHKDHCPGHYNSVRFPRNFGRQAWNKGLSKENDVRIRLQAEHCSITRKKNPIRLTPEQKARLSLIAKARGFGGYRENAGISKKFKVYDSLGNKTTLQSTYEYAVFEILEELSIRWCRPKSLKYDGKNYFADFYLIDFNIWLDPKNSYKMKTDSEKIKKVIVQNNVKLYVLSDKQITKDFISRVVQW